MSSKEWLRLRVFIEKASWLAPNDELVLILAELQRRYEERYARDPKEGEAWAKGQYDTFESRRYSDDWPERVDQGSVVSVVRPRAGRGRPRPDAAERRAERARLLVFAIHAPIK